MHDEASRWVSEDRGRDQAWDLLASALRKLADLRKFERDFDEARRAYGRAIEIGQKLVDAEPGNEPFATHLAIALDDLAGVEKEEQRLDVARDLFVQAEQLLARLVAADPENLESRMRCLHTRFKIARLDRDEGRYSEARNAFIRIRDELRVLSREGRLEDRGRLFTDDRTLVSLIDECTRGLRKSG